MRTLVAAIAVWLLACVGVQAQQAVQPGYQICRTTDPGNTQCSFQPVGNQNGTYAGLPMGALAVTSCGARSLTNGVPYVLAMDLTGNICITGSGASGLTVVTTPGAVTTTTTNSTIAVTSTFQPALAASATRKSCTIQNTGTRVQYFYFGVMASGTLSNALQVNPGQTISCATVNGLVLTDAVNVTGTAGDGYIVNSQ